MCADSNGRQAAKEKGRVMYIGVDTHKAQHVLAALDTQGRKVGTQRIANTPEGWASALA
jgi:(2Fe-2S) ferredoxin